MTSATHATWLIEDRVPRIMRLLRLGHKRKDVDDDYSHLTDTVIEHTHRTPAAMGTRRRMELARQPHSPGSSLTSSDSKCGQETVLPICSPKSRTAHR